MGKFKIGDRVRAICASGGGGVQAGDVFVVTKIGDEELGFFNPRRGKNDGWGESNFELVPTFTLTTDKFYRTRNGKVTGRLAKGDTGFEAVVDGKVRIYDAAGGHVHGDTDLDIVEAWMPRVGERVQFVKDGQSTTGAVGKAATLVTWSDGSFIAGDDYLLDIDPPVNYKTVAVTPNFTRATIDCFEPLPVAAPLLTGRPYPPTETPIANDNKPKFKVGDRVFARYADLCGNGTVTNVDTNDDDMPYRVDFGAEGAFWCYDEDVTSPQPEAENHEEHAVVQSSLAITIDTGNVHEALDEIIAKLKKIKKLQRQVGLAA
ncbi:hypothetical protein [Shinella sp.]|uniref:hypothetical protein n=1 Tax=Shinella sp. TaxID=1870904 RepID=UPI0028B08666|nr:hypothetical protein [Shinella sp.]